MKQIFKKSILLLSVLAIMVVGSSFNTQIGTCVNANIADASCTNYSLNIVESRNVSITITNVTTDGTCNITPTIIVTAGVEVAIL